VEPSLATGILLTLLAGLMSGNCMLPVKFTKSWKWENVWLVFSVVSLVILPWALAIALVNRLSETYRALSVHQLAIPFFWERVGDCPNSLRHLGQALRTWRCLRHHRWVRSSLRNTRPAIRRAKYNRKRTRYWLYPDWCNRDGGRNFPDRVGRPDQRESNSRHCSGGSASGLSGGNHAGGSLWFYGAHVELLRLLLGRTLLKQRFASETRQSMPPTQSGQSDWREVFFRILHTVSI